MIRSILNCHYSINQVENNVQYCSHPLHIIGTRNVFLTRKSEVALSGLVSYMCIFSDLQVLCAVQLSSVYNMFTAH